MRANLAATCDNEGTEPCSPGLKTEETTPQTCALRLQAVQGLADPLGDADRVQGPLGQRALALAVGEELLGDPEAQQRRPPPLAAQDLAHGRAEPAGEHVVLDG